MKRFLSFLISLVTLASCTGMLDDMQSQIDDLDSRVTVLEKDSKLISENLSTVKKDLEAGLETISILQKSTAEITDTLDTHNLRLQNDFNVSMNLIQTALNNIDQLKITDSELAQSIVDAYAAINVAMNLCKINTSNLTSSVSSLKNMDSSLKMQINDLQSQINVLGSRMSSLESTINNICSNYAHIHSTTINKLTNEVTCVEKNYNGYWLYRKTYRLNHAYSYVEYFFTPGRSWYQLISRSLGITSYTEGPYDGPCEYVTRQYADHYDGVMYDLSLADCSIRIGSVSYNVSTEKSIFTEGYYLYDKDRHVTIWFIDNNWQHCPDHINVYNKSELVAFNYALSDVQSSSIKSFFKSLLCYEDIITSGFSLTDFYKSWNSFVDSVDFLDDSFKVSI